MSTETKARVLLALAVMIGWLGTLTVLPDVTALPHPYGLARVLPLAWLTATPIRLAATLAQVVLLLLWITKRAGLSAVLPSLLMIQLYAFVEASFSAEPGSLSGHGKVPPYLAWLGFEVGRRIRRGHDGHHLGTELAAGFVAVLYFLGGTSKLIAGGITWPDGRAFSLLVAERIDQAPTLFQAGLEWLTLHPMLCALQLAGALIVELLGLAFLWPRARFGWALWATAMHIGIWLTMGYIHADWGLTVWAVVLWTSLHADEAPPTLAGPAAPLDGSPTALAGANADALL